MTDDRIINQIKAREYFRTAGQALMNVDVSLIDAVVEKIKNVKRYSGTVWIAGNGGSASTASHFSNDLMKMAGVRAIAISDMTPTTLAYMNDDGVSTMFRKPLDVMIGMHDLVFVISCSGNSENIVELAKVTVRPVILLTGDQKGKAYKYADIAINVPDEDIRVQEDVHLAICHNIVGLLNE